jgi:ADP-L-glycero-D-manno-heptose 6-epimerase
MIIVTGAAGFIGSNLVGLLNSRNINDIIVVDEFSRDAKNINLEGKNFVKKIDREEFFKWFNRNHDQVDFVFHLGARTNTAEFDKTVFDHLNYGYSVKMFESCSTFNIPLIYASSAATYGLGELGYNDDHDVIEHLKPLNPYGESKNEFDRWVLKQSERPPFWAGLKFFNVYGPNEYHKGRMASVIFHAFSQIGKTGAMKLFRSHKEGIPDGGQKRDFIYVKDVVSVIYFLFREKPASGIYNLGTGIARTFLDLTTATFRAMDLVPDISFIDTPEDIRDKYQYFTEANMAKLRAAGYKQPFYTLEEGITDYVKNYLKNNLKI